MRRWVDSDGAKNSRRSVAPAMEKSNSDMEQGGCLRLGVVLGAYGMVLVVNILPLSAICVALVL